MVENINVFDTRNYVELKNIVEIYKIAFMSNYLGVF